MPLSWVTVVWSLMAAACLTLAALYFGVWYKDRRERAHLFFSMAAASMAAFAAGELWMMRAATPAELLTAIRWSNLPLYTWLMSTVWFVAVYLGTGRRWFLLAILGVRTLSLFINFVPGPSLTYTAIADPLQHIQFLGETVTVPAGTPNPWLVVSQASSVMILIFVADASITAWRRGDRRKAALVGGSIEIAFLTALLSALPVTWGGAQAPFIFSVPFMLPVLVMGNELMRAVQRASQLFDELKASEAGLREQTAQLQASHQQITDLFGRLLATQETERARLARDLHDDVGQRIVCISIALSGLKRKLGPDQESTAAALASVQQNINSLAEEIRHVSHDLHPTLLQHAGLISALRAVCSQFGKRHGIVAFCHADDHVGAIGNEDALALFRVAQDALRNVSQHAGATEVDVALTATPAGVRLTIADNGKGFDLAAARQRADGLGLLSIDERVRRLNGTVDITTAPGAGTTVQVNVPSRVTASI